MCQSQQHPNQSREGATGEDFQHWQGLYPDLSSLLNQPEQDQNQRRPSLFLLLLNFLGINTNPSSTAPNMDSGSSPPTQPTSPGPGNNPSQEQSTSGNGQPQAHCNCHGNQQPDLITLLVGRFSQFSVCFTRCFVVFLAIIMFVTTVSLLPNSLLYSAVYLLLAAGLGLPLPTLLAGHVLYALLNCFDPLFVVVISIWAAHKTFIRRKPLVDVQFWKRRIAGLETN
eukprot:GFUD01037240.1.p1 GENE.GFUD01037240.1~~GFUD01037240.1.p1  ORF type:complete len:226 (+),score=40.45 GFUD01037240.1:129-806(+)